MALTRREAPQTILVIQFPPDGKLDWYVTNPDISFTIENIDKGVPLRVFFRFDDDEEIQWDGEPIKIPSDGQHILEYRSVAVLEDEVVIPPGRKTTVPRYFAELPIKFLFKLDTTQPKVGHGLIDLFDNRILITNDFFVNDGSAILTSVMPGSVTGTVFFRTDPSFVPPAGAEAIDPNADGQFILQIDTERPVPGSFRVTSHSLVENTDYTVDHFESDGKVFVLRIDGGSWPLDTEVAWSIGIRQVVRYENRDGRQRFTVRFPSEIEVFSFTAPELGETVDIGRTLVDVVNLTTEVTVTTEHSGGALVPGPGTFVLLEQDGRILLQNNAGWPLIRPNEDARLRLRGIRNQTAIERVEFVDDGTAFLLDESTSTVFGLSSFTLDFDDRARLLSVVRTASDVPRDRELILEVKLAERSETAKFIDFGTYNAPTLPRGFTINKEQSVWFYARDPCGRREGESTVSLVIDDVDSGISKIFFTFDGEEPVEDESDFVDTATATLPAPTSFQNRFVFRFLAIDRAGNSENGFLTNVGEALVAPLILPDSFLTKEIEKIHFAPKGEVLDESSPFILQSGDFIVVEKSVCQGSVVVSFLVKYTDGTSAVGEATVSVFNDFLIGSFVPQIVSEFGPGDKDSEGKRWFRGFRPIAVLPIFGPRPTDLDPDTPFPSKIFWKWSDEDIFKEYVEPFTLRDEGRNVLNLYVTFIDGNNNGTESAALQFTYYWDNTRPTINDNTEPKWINRDAIVFFTPEDRASGVKGTLFRVWKETLETPPGGTADAQSLVDLNDVLRFFLQRDPEAFAESQPSDLTDEQINEYLRLVNLPPVESMEDWALAGGFEDDTVRVLDQRILNGESFTEINRRIGRLEELDPAMPFIRLIDPGRYHISAFVLDNANNISANESDGQPKPVFTNFVVQIDQTPPLVSLAFDQPTTVTLLPDGTQLIELDAYPDIDIIAIDSESGVTDTFFRFGGRNRIQNEVVLPGESFTECDRDTTPLPSSGEFVRFDGTIRLDTSGLEFEDDIFFFGIDRAGNRSEVTKAIIRVRITGDEFDTEPPVIRDIIPKNGKIDLSRNAHIQFWIQDCGSGVDIKSVKVVVNNQEFQLEDRPALVMQFIPPEGRRDIEFLVASIVSNNLILRDNFGIHTFLDGTVTKEARISFDDDSFNTFEEVSDFLNDIPGVTADLTSPSLKSLDPKLLLDVADRKIFDRSANATDTAQPAFLSLVQEFPQFSFFARSRGFVIDISPRAEFDSRGEVRVSIDAKDTVGNAMETVNLIFVAQEIRTQTAAERNDIFRRSKRFFDRMQENTASIYNKNPFTRQAGFFKALSHEYAKAEREAILAASNARFEDVPPRFLFRNFGSLMDIIGTRFISHQRYRQLLLDGRDGYLEGSRPAVMRETFSAWAVGGVQVIDLADINPDEIADQHKIQVTAFFDETTRRHIVTHPDPLKSGFEKFVLDFRPAHLSLGLSFGFQEQFEFQAGCEPICVTEDGFRAIRLIIEPAKVVNGRCVCCGTGEECDCLTVPELQSVIDLANEQVVWGPVETINFAEREYTTNFGRIRVFVEEGCHSVVRRRYQNIEGCDRVPIYECITFDDIQVGDCLIAMGSFQGTTPVFRDGPWFNIWLTPEAYTVIRECDPELPEDIAVFDELGQIVGGYVGLDKDGQSRVPPYDEYTRFLKLSADLARSPSQRRHLVPGHVAFREVVAKLESCPGAECDLVIKQSPTAICDCLIVTLQFVECDNLRKTSDEVESVAKLWEEDVTTQWDGTGIYVLKGRPMLSISRFIGDLRLASQPHEVLVYVNCELVVVSSFDPVRGTVCLTNPPQQGQRVVVRYYANEHASVVSQRFSFTVDDDGGMDLLDRETPIADDVLNKIRIQRDACEPLDEVNERNADFAVESCLLQPNQEQPPDLCQTDVEPFSVFRFNDSRLAPHELGKKFFLNAFSGIKEISPLHAPVIDHFPASCLNLQEIRLHPSFNDAKTFTNDPGTRHQQMDFIEGPEFPDRSIDFTEVCTGGQSYYDGYYYDLYGAIVDAARDAKRQCFGFIDYDLRRIGFAVEETALVAPNFICYNDRQYYQPFNPQATTYLYTPYYFYHRCMGAEVSGDGPTTSGGCESIFESNPWIMPLFDVRAEPLWVVEGAPDDTPPFPIGKPLGGGEEVGNCCDENGS